MRTIPLKQVWDKVVRLHGRNPRSAIGDDMRDALVEHINYRVRIICNGWDWPEWRLTEERAFRPVWSSTEQYVKVLADGTPEEVFYLGAGYVVGGAFGTNYGYYRVKASAPSDPPVGTVPTNATYWEPMTTVDTFIQYDQRDRRAIGSILAVYSRDPRVPTGSAGGGRQFMPSEKGVDVRYGGPTVFITQKMPVPIYTMVPYVVGKTYTRGNVVFDPASGECYQAFNTTTAVVTDTAHWNWVPFLDKWSEYVAQGAFADSLMEFDQGGNGDIQAKMVMAQAANERADNCLQSEVDALTVQGQTLQYNFCRNRSRWRESEAWAGNGLVYLIS